MIPTDLSLVVDGHPALTTVSQPFDVSQISEWSSVFTQMYEIMTSHRGIGLAANQVGLLYRFFIMKMNGEPEVVINPEILSTSEEVESMEEGCLSFSNLYLKVKRFTTVKVRYTDQLGNVHEKDLSGIEAQCFQHELEHLDGIVFVSKVPALSLQMAKEKRAKLIKRLIRLQR